VLKTSGKVANDTHETMKTFLTKKNRSKFKICFLLEQFKFS